MFRMKNLSNENDSKSPSTIVNYKQALRSRLLVKQGIFPQAIKTNIMSRDVRTVHSPPISANPMNQHLNNYNVLNKLFGEENTSKEPFSDTPYKNEHRESFCITSYQCQMSVNATTSPRKSVILSDSPKYEALQDPYMDENLSQSSTSMTRKKIEACMPSTDFSYYSPQQAHNLLLYKEMCQILKKTMIMEKVKHFENFPDMVQEVRNKLWKIRSSRENNFNPNENPSIHREGNTFDPFTDDELCSYQSSPYFPLPVRSSPNFVSPVQYSCKSDLPKRVDIDDALAPMPFELKVPDQPDLMESSDGISSEAIVDDCTLTDSGDEADEPQIPAYRLRSVKFRWNYQHSIFSSTLIPTCKLDHNLTMNPIEFLENLSKANDNKDVHQHSYDLNVFPSTSADSGPNFDDYRGSASKWLRGVNMEDPLYKVNGRSDLEDNNLKDCFPDGHTSILMEHPYHCTELKQSSASEMARPMEKSPEILSDPDYFFPSLASASTPEMKYYPCRLH